MDTRIAASSKEYLSVPVTSPQAGLITLPVEIAIIPDGADPDETDWHFATWDTDGNASILIGPGQPIELTPARKYVVWVRITSNPERPILRSGMVGTY